MSDRSAAPTGFTVDESGAATIWAIFWFVIFTIMTGLAMDTGNAYRHTAALRATADSSALAGMMAYMDRNKYASATGDTSAPSPETRAVSAARQVGTANMNGSVNNPDPANDKTVVRGADVTLGRWDGTSFSSTDTPVNAVRVVAARRTQNGNPLKSFMLGALTPWASWDVGAAAVAETFKNECLSREALVAGRNLILTANNGFSGAFCLHGEAAVDANANNGFWDDTTVSYGRDGAACNGLGNCGDTTAINASTAGASGTPSLQERLSRKADYMPDVNGFYEDVYDAVTDPLAAMSDPMLIDFIPAQVMDGRDADGLPTSLDPAVSLPWQISETEFEAFLLNAAAAATGTPVDALATPAYLPPGASAPSDGLGLKGRIIDVAPCAPDRTILVPGDVLLAGAVIVTDCMLIVETGAVLSDITVVTRSSDTVGSGQPAIEVQSGAVLGVVTCTGGTPAADVKMFARGDQIYASGVDVGYTQIVAGQDVVLPAGPNGLGGVQALAGRDLVLTSNGMISGCVNFDSENAFVPDDYRLVQ